MKTYLISLAIIIISLAITHMLSQRKLRKMRILTIIQNLDRVLEHNTIATSVESGNQFLIIDPNGSRDEVVYAIEHELRYYGLHMDALKTDGDIWSFKIRGPSEDYNCEIVWKESHCSFLIY